MNANILNVTEKALFDNSIINAERHTHQPYASTTLNNNDEIRIPLQQQDLYVLPWNSLIYIEGKLITHDNKVSATAKLVNNALAFLFSEIRYEIGGLVVDRVRNPGLTSTMKGYVSYNTNESKRLENAGWSPTKDITTNLVDKKGNFNVCIPLSMILGFCEDFRKIILNLRQELVLIRSSSDVNAIVNSTEGEDMKIELTKVLWKVPHISVNDVERLTILKYMERSIDLELAFRSWELHEYPLLQETQRHSWSIKTTTQLETPRYVIVGFQTDRKNKYNKDMSKFDHCNLTNIKLYLNSEMYPYDNLNLNFSNNQWAILYEMYAQFQQSYYERQSEPVFSPSEFIKNGPLFVIDCMFQSETLKSGTVDIRLEFETSANVPSNTAAYCLILHDRIIKYNPLTSAVSNI